MAKVLLGDRHALRACILYEFLHGNKAAAAHRNICQALGEGAPQYDMVKFWFRRFKNGEYNLEDRPNRPKTRRRSGIDDDIKEEIEKDLATGWEIPEKDLATEWEIPSILGLTADVVHSRSTESGTVESEAITTDVVHSGPTESGAVENELITADVVFSCPTDSGAVGNESITTDVVHSRTAESGAAENGSTLHELLSAQEGPTSSCVKEEAVVVPVILQSDSNSKNSSLLRSLLSDSGAPSSSKEVCAPAQVGQVRSCPRPTYHIGRRGKLYPGVVEASKRGIYPVIKYTLPDGEYCYAFEHLRYMKKEGLVVYRCTRCRKKGASTSIASCRAIASDPQLAEAKPNQLWKSIARFINDNAPEDETQRKMMLRHFYRNGYKSRRTTIARAAAKLHRAAIKKSAEELEDRTENALLKE
ncbi:hypothetical protein GCK32_011231 [Trichostrongylus colubriformis]|uniref:Mos1 transposase HTH domain-containing protein n=1 Tax=Trichostrongylus colubriformis TaxID=6319 RepID=A0AAN8F3K0_TRICO